MFQKDIFLIYTMVNIRKFFCKYNLNNILFQFCRNVVEILG